MVAWVGFRQKTVLFSVPVRPNGSTKWSQRALIKYAISNLLSFSSLPLKLVNYFAACFFVFAVLLGAFSLYHFFRHNAVAGYTTVVIVLLLIGSGIMTGLGIIGEYIARIHDEAKMRPRYFKLEDTAFNDDKN
jgi:dolichol-phosphate mannosyltransferase